MRKVVRYKLSVLWKNAERKGTFHAFRRKLQKRPASESRPYNGKILQLLEIAFCFVHDLVQGNLFLFGELFAVFKFGSGVANVAIDSRNLHADVAELCVDVDGFARK